MHFWLFCVCFFSICFVLFYFVINFTFNSQVTYAPNYTYLWKSRSETFFLSVHWGIFVCAQLCECVCVFIYLLIFPVFDHLMILCNYYLFSYMMYLLIIFCIPLYVVCSFIHLEYPFFHSLPIWCFHVHTKLLYSHK